MSGLELVAATPPNKNGKGDPQSSAVSPQPSPSPEAAAARAAAVIATRIGRESAPREPRPQTKAAAKRERQAANPRKETASERNLREKREAERGGT